MKKVKVHRNPILFKIIPINNLLKYNIYHWASNKTLNLPNQYLLTHLSIIHLCIHSLNNCFFNFVPNQGLDWGYSSKQNTCRALPGRPMVCFQCRGYEFNSLVRDLRSHKHERKGKKVAFT